MADRNTWGTPQGLFDERHALRHFTVDACALPSNAKLPRYWSPVEDGLKQPWAGERLWINPPYGEGLILPWVRRAIEEPLCLAEFLLPARTDMDWWHLLWHQYLLRWRKVEIYWPLGRVDFDRPVGVEKTSSYNERNVIVTLFPRMTP